MSKDSVISKTTDLFGRKIQVVGRTCIVDDTVNSSAITSGNILFEQYYFQFNGEMTITENCPKEDKVISVNWNFTSEANITLPWAQ